MQSTLRQLQHICYQAFCEAFPSYPISLHNIEITLSTQIKFGHYQCNSAMKLASTMKKNPREIAQAMTKQIKNKLIEKIDIAGPGFINFTLNATYFSERLNLMLQDDHLGITKTEGNKKIIIDFSSPNIAKEMHVGHLRSTIIGDCLARTFEFCGYDVLRLNHIGDWGTAFGMLIAYLKLYEPKVLQGEQHTDLTELMQWYRASKKKFDEEEGFKKNAQQEVVALQSGHPESLKAWQIICDISRLSYRAIYQLLHVSLIERGESFYNPYLATVIKELENKNMITISDGAKCIYLEGFENREHEPLPLIIQKSDGGFNYATTDLAAIKHRIDEEKADRIIYVTDNGQAMHFAMIFKAAEKAGYLSYEKVRVDHVGFGLVLGPDGKKFKTRSGETERLIDLLIQAIARANNILRERNVNMNEEELKVTAQCLGINAVKYADLSCHRTGDYIFSYDRMLRFEGNTAAFLMYSYVRINGIKRKVNFTTEALNKTTIRLTHPAEITLGHHLDQFGTVIDNLMEDLFPHRLTEYLYQLAQLFNIFFRDCRVEGDEQQNSRLLLCELTANVMRQGMTLLGLQMVERM